MLLAIDMSFRPAVDNGETPSPSPVPLGCASGTNFTSGIISLIIYQTLHLLAPAAPRRTPITDPEIIIQSYAFCDLDMIFLRIMVSLHYPAVPANINVHDKYCYDHLKLLIVNMRTVLTAINVAKL